MQQAVHVDHRTGLRHDVELLDVGDIAGLRAFGSRYVPPGKVTGGVVVCSPIFAELPKNYRREVLLGQALAARGLAVQRFHYRGAGHSDGDDFTLHTMLDDAVAATERLVAVTGVTRLAFLGTRLGALVAAATAASFAGAPLALWDPVVDPEVWLGEVLANRKLGDESAAEPADVLGYSLGRVFAESLHDHDLLSAGGNSPRPRLIVQFGDVEALPPDYAELVRHWQKLGQEVETAIVANQQGWWFLDDPRLKDTALLEGTPLLSLTVDWLVRHLFGAEIMP